MTSSRQSHWLNLTPSLAWSSQNDWALELNSLSFGSNRDWGLFATLGPKPSCLCRSLWATFHFQSAPSFLLEEPRTGPEASRGQVQGTGRGFLLGRFPTKPWRQSADPFLHQALSFCPWIRFWVPDTSSIEHSQATLDAQPSPHTPRPPSDWWITGNCPSSPGSRARPPSSSSPSHVFSWGAVLTFLLHPLESSQPSLGSITPKYNSWISLPCPLEGLPPFPRRQPTGPSNSTAFPISHHITTQLS